jgi:hypothetical protein
MPRSAIAAGEGALLSSEIQQTHPVLGGLIVDAPHHINRKVFQMNLRQEQLKHSLQIKELVVLPTLEGNSSVGVMFTSPQVQPLDLQDLPWLTPPDVDSIRSSEAYDRKALLLRSGRQPTEIIADRRTVVALENSGSVSSLKVRSTGDALSTASFYSHGGAAAVVESPTGAREEDFHNILRTTSVASMSSSGSSPSPRAIRSIHVHRITKTQNRVMELMESDIRSNSSAGRTVTSRVSVPTWEDLRHQNRELFQFSKSPMERIRKVRSRVQSGPIRELTAMPSAESATHAMGPHVVHHVALHDLPDPDELTFDGIDIDVRLLDADL